MTATPSDSVREGRKKVFTNQKFYGRSFADQDLSHADFRGATLCECDFSNSNLEYALFEGANCYRANFAQARLYHTNFKDAVLAQSRMDPRDAFGMTLSLTCDTFDRMELGERWLASWLYMATLALMPDELRKKVRAIIGEPRMDALDRIFRERAI